MKNVIACGLVVVSSACIDEANDTCRPTVSVFELQCSEVSDLENAEKLPAVHTAPAGGLWWVSSVPLINRESGEVESNLAVGRLEELGFDSFGLADANGDPVPLDIVRDSQSVLAIRVPEAPNVAPYTVLVDGEPTALSLEVSAATSDPLIITSFEAGPALAQNCDSACFESGKRVPRSATVELGWTGGPGLLQIVELGSSGEVALVQDYLLEETTTGTLERFIVSMPVAPGQSLDISVEARVHQLSDLSGLTTQTLVLSSLDETELLSAGQPICDGTTSGCD